MSIVITAPAGNIGSVVTRELLDAGEKPVLIARDPAKVDDAVARGATVKKGSHADADFMTEATQGAAALFVLTPAHYQLQDIHAYYGSFARAAATAAKANGIPHVVHLSSVGADLESGNGPVAGLHAAEQILNEADLPNLTHLRPGYFMENTLAQIPNILQASSLFTTFPAGTRIPMIATRDIGVRAAGLLRERDWTGRNVVELQGASVIAYEEVAAILSGVLGRKLEHVTVSDAQMIEALTGMGLSPVLAESYAELADGLVKGRIQYREPHNEANTTSTTYEVFARQAFKPALEAAARA